jgi:putative MATE family efflux protein
MDRKMTLAGLALPIFVENFLNKLLTMVNVYLLARLSQDAVAAIGVANQFINFITMAFSFVTFGTAVVIAQNRGAGDEERAGQAATTAVAANVLFGLLIGVLILLFHRPLLRMMNMEGALMTYSATYLTIIGGCCFLQALNLTLATIMRNYGQAKAPMMVFLFMNVINLLGNAAVVMRPFGLPDFGIAGIATCTVLSQLLAAVAMIACAVKARVQLRLPRPFPFRLLSEILKIGLPGAGDGLAFNVANIALTYFVSGMGAAALAAQTYAVQFIAFVQVLGYSVGQGSQILVGYHCGARDFDGAYKLAWRGVWIAMGLNLAVMALVFLFQAPLLSLFTDSAEIGRMVFWCLVVDVILEFGRPFNLVLGVSLRGTGDVMWALAASVGSICLVCIPVGYVLTQVFHLGVYSIFIALLCDEWLRGQLMAYRWRTRKWEKYVLIKDDCAA